MSRTKNKFGELIAELPMVCEPLKQLLLGVPNGEAKATPTYSLYSHVTVPLWSGIRQPFPDRPLQSDGLPTLEYQPVFQIRTSTMTPIIPTLRIKPCNGSSSPIRHIQVSASLRLLRAYFLRSIFISRLDKTQTSCTLVSRINLKTMSYQFLSLRLVS